MFKKMVIANRGEIAVRVMQACKELGIRTVGLYTDEDIGSLHVRFSDECAALDQPGDFFDPGVILGIAKEKEADSIHPGYGYLAEKPEFFRAGEEAGFRIIGPQTAVMEALRCRLAALQRAREAGFPTVLHSPASFDGGDLGAIRREAGRLGYPVLIKSCQGGRGPGERWVQSPDRLEKTLNSALAEAHRFYGPSELYLEKTIQPAYEVGVLVIRDFTGRSVHLGEYQSLVQHGNRRVIVESPAPILSPSQREAIQQTARELADLFQVNNAVTIEFLMDEEGRFYFAEIKTSLQPEHPLMEMSSRVDLVQTGIRLAAGERLRLEQNDISLRGCALLCRINAEDPWNAFLPSPGRIRRVWQPGGPNVRVDTYIYSGCKVPGEYDPSIAKLTTWGEDRQTCMERMRRSLGEFRITGIHTNLSLLQSILNTAEFARGRYPTDFQPQREPPAPQSGDTHSVDTHQRDLAAAAAVIHLLREQCQPSPVPNGRGMNLWQKSLRIPSPWNYKRISNEKNGSTP